MLRRIRELVGPFGFEDCAHSVAVECQLESMIFRELRDFVFSIHLVDRPDPLQFFLSNRAVMDSISDSISNVQLILDLLSQSSHR